MAILAVALIASPSPAFAAEVDEYQAKALFVYKFATFVDWPAGAFKGESEAVAICILGQTPFTKALENTVQNKRVEARGFVVRVVSEPRQAAGCHLLFVATSGLKSFRAMKSELATVTGLLVVGESNGFATEGGAINFKLADGRIRLEINPAEAKREKLAINARLLGMAEVVGK